MKLYHRSLQWGPDGIYILRSHLLLPHKQDSVVNPPYASQMALGSKLLPFLVCIYSGGLSVNADASGTRGLHSFCLTKATSQLQSTWWPFYKRLMLLE